MLGMIEGNGHPYSWSAIINGYDPEAMARCPYPVIPQYLNAQPSGSVRIPEANVTHIWTDNPEDAPLVAAASKIPHVVSRPEDVIGQVDAVIIATDDGTDHVRRARPFVEAGLPVFIDKPLATTPEELRQFVEWKKQGARILSSSGLRYAREIQELAGKPWLWITASMCKSWERYGIHALEPLMVLLGPGFKSVSATRTDSGIVATLHHQSGVTATIGCFVKALGSMAVFHAYGAEGHASIRITDTYFAFRAQLVAAIKWFRDGIDPYPFENTVELMKIIISAGQSALQDGQTISLS